jgi:hypothetical protein
MWFDDKKPTTTIELFKTIHEYFSLDNEPVDIQDIRDIHIQHPKVFLHHNAMLALQAYKGIFVLAPNILNGDSETIEKRIRRSQFRNYPWDEPWDKPGTTKNKTHISFHLKKLLTFIPFK